MQNAFMKSKSFLFLSLFLSMTTLSLATSTGYIQVKCNTPADVYIDGSQVGSTSVEQAILIIEVYAKRHSIEIRKSGFRTQTFSVVVETAKVKQFEVGPFRKTHQVFVSGKVGEKSMKQKIGSLKLQTIPVECSIDISQLQFQTNKTKADWCVKDIAVGIYDVALTATVPVNYITKNKIADKDSESVGIEPKVQHIQVPVVSDQETYLLVNLITGEIKDIPAEQLLDKALEYAKQAEESNNIENWRNVIKYAEQALAICQIEPKDAKRLLDRAINMVRTHEQRPDMPSERRITEKGDLAQQHYGNRHHETLNKSETHRYTLVVTDRPFANYSNHPFSGKKSLVGDSISISLSSKSDETTLIMKVTDDQGKVLSDGDVSGKDSHLSFVGGLAVNCKIHVDVFESSMLPAQYQLIFNRRRNRFLEGTHAQYHFVIK